MGLFDHRKDRTAGSKITLSMLAGGGIGIILGLIPSFGAMVGVQPLQAAVAIFAVVGLLIGAAIGYALHRRG